MAFAANSLKARIEWCHRQRTRVLGDRESEEWHAEEDGLRDALHNQDHSNQYQYTLPAIYTRYLIGLQDGRDLLRVDAVKRYFRIQGRH